VFGIVKSMCKRLLRYRTIFFGLLPTKKESKILKQGRWKEFNKNAILIAEGQYINGKKEGSWKEYFDSGELMIEEDFVDGIPCGQFVSYHRNGYALSEGQFCKGLRSGEFKIYNASGGHIKSLFFECNNLIQEIEYKKINYLVGV